MLKFREWKLSEGTKLSVCSRFKSILIQQSGAIVKEHMKLKFKSIG